MHRRIALAAVACALALPASALASGPAATGAGGVAVQPASGLKVTSLKASRSGRAVTVKVRWDRALVARKAERERFTVRLVSGPAGQRRVLGTVSRRAPRGTSETVRFGLSARNARRVKGSSRVFATATQQFDSPDTDRLYELNHVAIASMKGKRPFASAAASSCPTEIKPDTDMTGCQLPGANLSGANLLGVIFYKANLEVSNLSGANLRTTNLTQADLTGANLRGATMSDGEQASLTFPDDGAEIGKLIDSAKTSVDVIIYSFGGPNIVGQASSPGPLMRAVSRGVNVRVIVNSGNLDCKTDQEADQSNCLGSPKLDGVYVTEAALKSAADTARAQGKTPGNYRVQFSSQNYQITHQKSILIDTSDKFGNALSEEELKQVPSSQILVSTGNLQSYNWGSFLKWDSTKKGYVVANANYLTDPATSCVAISGKPCADEWAARDFAIKVTDPKLMARITAVYAADQTCKRWDEAPVYQQLLGSGLADTWANGTLQANGSAPPTSYPAQGTDAFYSGFGPNLQLQLTPDGTRVVPQGNSRQRQLDLIASATTTLVVYNEEMEDADILNALVAAEKRGVDVRVVMSSAFTGSTPTPSGETTSFNFSYLASNGVRIKFFNSNPDSTDLYIHAKAIVADGVNAFMGSENFGYASMNYNRELGLMLTNSTDPQVKSPSPSVVSVGGVAAIMTAFSKDWNSSEAVAFVPLKKVDGPVPQPKPGLPFDNPKGSGKWTYNANCLPPVNGDLFTPKLPSRIPPPHS